MIELIVVIVILAILGAMALPRFIDFRKRSELSIAQHLEGTLKEAREFYYLRLVVERPVGIDPMASACSFWSFVDLSGDVSARNTFKIDKNIRDMLQTPSANIYQNDGTLLLPFKGGGTAIYFISSTTGAITAEYSGF